MCHTIKEIFDYIHQIKARTQLDPAFPPTESEGREQTLFTIKAVMNDIELRRKILDYRLAIERKQATDIEALNPVTLEAINNITSSLIQSKTHGIGVQNKDIFINNLGLLYQQAHSEEYLSSTAPFLSSAVTPPPSQETLDTAKILYSLKHPEEDIGSFTKAIVERRCAASKSAALSRA